METDNKCINNHKNSPEQECVKERMKSGVLMQGSSKAAILCTLTWEKVPMNAVGLGSLFTCIGLGCENVLVYCLLLQRILQKTIFPVTFPSSCRICVPGDDFIHLLSC